MLGRRVLLTVEVMDFYPAVSLKACSASSCKLLFLLIFLVLSFGCSMAINSSKLTSRFQASAGCNLHAYSIHKLQSARRPMAL